MSIKICQPSNSRITAGAAIGRRNANGKINLKEEQTLVGKEMLFGSSDLPDMFLLFFQMTI